MGSRQHRRAEKVAREREALKVIFEWKNLYQPFSKRNHQYVELEEPVFWGYRRYFVLKEKYAEGNKAQRWQAILEVIQKVEDSTRKDFKVRRGLRGIWKTRPHQLKVLSEDDFQQKIPSRWHHFFREEFHQCRRFYRFLLPELFESRMTKVYITHRLILDREYEQRISYLNNAMWNRGEVYWLNRRHGPKNPWKKYEVRDRDRCSAKNARKEIQEALLTHSQGEIPVREHSTYSAPF